MCPKGIARVQNLISSEPKTPPPVIVGIGASAGGLEALTQLIQGLDVPLGAGIVVVQHVSPDHRSLLRDLLARETKLNVVEIEHLQEVQPNHIHITPANANVELVDGRLHLTAPAAESHPKPSVDLFFKSLARYSAERAIAVVLSGTGSDGSEGCRVTKHAGGKVLVQQPDSAKYSGMPLSALERCSVDYCLPSRELGQLLNTLVAEVAKAPAAAPVSLSRDESLDELLDLVLKQTNSDFRDYKDATLYRRIARRVASCGKANIDDYIHYAKETPDELIRLQKDILISVTAFFRDETAFEELKKVISQILSRKRESDELRVWVPGCATGEEIYSIGMVLADLLGQDIRKYNVQLYATDVDTDALRLARAGQFSAASLEALPINMVERYFDPVGEQYEIKKFIRDMIIFARQDLVVDPPFMRQDLISCRNVMIYFKADLQNRILTTFHYALAPKGVLFLGKSESVFYKEELFDTLSKDSKLYIRKETSSIAVPGLYPKFRAVNKLPKAKAQEQKDFFQVVLEKTALASFLPNAIIYNDAFVVHYIHGDCSAITAISAGRPSFDLNCLLRKELQNQLQSLTRRAASSGGLVHGQAKKVSVGRGHYSVELFVTRLSSEGLGNIFLLGFNKVADRKKQPKAERSAETDLELELAATRDHLQRVIEELEGANQEMHALNEEVQASNEELQSMNEELEAANEELQSTNEELTTVNEELQTKALQILSLANELECVQNSLDFPLLVVNQAFGITKFNNAAASIFQLSIGRKTKNLTEINLGSNTGLMDAALKVMVNGIALDMEVADLDNRSYLVHIAPYSGGEASGVLLLFIDQTESLQLNKSLQKHEQWLRTLMDHSAALFSVKDISGRYTFINRPFAETFGIEQQTIVGKSDTILFPDERCKWVRDQELEVMRQGNSVACEEEIQIGGRTHYYWSVRFPLLDQNGLIQAICYQATDISQRREMENQLQLSASVFERSMEAVVVMDANLNIIKTNEAFSRLTGFNQAHVTGQNIHSLLCLNTPDKNTAPVLRWGENWQGAVWLNHRLEKQRLFWFSINAVANNHGRTLHHVALFYDITEQYQHEEKIEYLATHDELTGLPNRVLLRDRLDQLLSRNLRNKTLFAIFFIDLDDFKLVNDTHGHEAGDELLQAVSLRLKNIVRGEDTIARIGGDEFVIVQEFNTGQHPAMMASKILEALHTPIALASNAECFANASIGISLYPQDGTSALELMRAADTAMYRAKNSGPGQYQFFKPEMAVDINQRLDIINGLRDAMAKNEFSIVVQPQLNAQTEAVTGVEVLLRWTHNNKAIAPDEFIPLAEGSGLMHPIGHWVLTKACQLLAQFKEQGLGALTVSVNVSTKQFNSDQFVTNLLELINIHGINANLLTLEITESAVINFDKSIESLLRLREAGIHISLDDFGTGYSSLSYLKRLPIQELKIDRSFIDGLGSESEDNAITAAILAMSKQLDLRVVAEGVESDIQLQMLKKLSCDYVQGFSFSKPLEVREFLHWHRHYKARSQGKMSYDIQ